MLFLLLACGSPEQATPMTPETDEDNAVQINPISRQPVEEEPKVNEPTFPEQMPEVPEADEFLTVDLFEESVIYRFESIAYHDDLSMTELGPEHREHFRWVIQDLYLNLGQEQIQQLEGEHKEGWRVHRAPWWREWYLTAREVTRLYLQNPDNVWKTYELMKPVVTNRTASWEYREVAVLYLRDVEQQLRTPPNQDLVLAYRVGSHYSLGDDGYWEYRRQLEQRCNDVGVDSWILGWQLRRQAEGGDLLVQTWADVFVDLADTLENQTPEEPTLESDEL